MEKHSVRNGSSLLLFLILVVGGGLAIGSVTAPADWYAKLKKPSFNPPNWVFGPVWTILYVLIAVAGWRIWSRGGPRAAKQAWVAQLALNFLWSPVFFSARRVDLGLGVVLALFIAITGFIVRSWREDRIASLLFGPYAMWVGYASLLNAAVLYLNEPAR